MERRGALSRRRPLAEDMSVGQNRAVPASASGKENVKSTVTMSGSTLQQTSPPQCGGIEPPDPNNVQDLPLSERPLRVAPLHLETTRSGHFRMERRVSLAVGDLSRRTCPWARTAQCLPPQKERMAVPADQLSSIRGNRTARPEPQFRISLQAG